MLNCDWRLARWWLGWVQLREFKNLVDRRLTTWASSFDDGIGAFRKNVLHDRDVRRSSSAAEEHGRWIDSSRARIARARRLAEIVSVIQISLPANLSHFTSRSRQAAADLVVLFFCVEILLKPIWEGKKEKSEENRESWQTLEPHNFVLHHSKYYKLLLFLFIFIAAWSWAPESATE